MHIIHLRHLRTTAIFNDIVSTRKTLNQTIRIQYDFTHRSNLYEGVLSSARQASPD